MDSDDLQSIFPLSDANHPLFFNKAHYTDEELDFTTDVASPNKIYEKKPIWKMAAWKACHANQNVWEDFDLNIATEIGIRHTYDPKTASWSRQNIELKLEKEAFDSGAQRLCFRLKKILTAYDKNGKKIESGLSCENDVDRWKSASNYVAKRYKGETSKSYYFKDIQLQMDAKLWGHEYNRHKPPKGVDIIQVTLLEIPSQPVHKYYHLERYIEGEYVKYNSNTGFVNDENMRLTPQAFSHFTFEKSGHTLIIVDIQGVGDLWTDPQIHTIDGTDYTEGNLGVHGMALFFHSHICNRICHSLMLSTFDLSINEIVIHKAYITSMKSSDTVLRGDEVCLNFDKTGKCNYGFLAINVEDMSVSEYESVDTIFHKTSVRHRSSCIENEIGRINADLLKSNVITVETSILGQVHLELCKCHENGRFVCATDPEPDLISAFFHLELAAKCQIDYACINIAKIYFKIPSDILCGYEPQCDAIDKIEKGTIFMKAAAHGGNKDAMIYLANMYEIGLKFSKNYIKSIKQAVYWYSKAIESNESPENYSDTSFDYPLCRLYAKLGNLYKIGGEDLEPCLIKAANYYNQAAEIAMNKMEGKLANEYYMKAEECYE